MRLGERVNVDLELLWQRLTTSHKDLLPKPLTKQSLNSYSYNFSLACVKHIVSHSSSPGCFQGYFLYPSLYTVPFPFVWCHFESLMHLLHDLDARLAHELPDDRHGVEPLDEELAPVVLELLLPTELAPKMI